MSSARSIARTMDVIGEWWTPLILRDLFVGMSRFEDLRRDLGIATNVLTDRLGTLVREGIIEQIPSRPGSTRSEYALTAKGRDLYPVILAVMAWGDRWTGGEHGPPALIRHLDCGADTSASVVCAHCGAELSEGAAFCTACGTASATLARAGKPAKSTDSR